MGVREPARVFAAKGYSTIIVVVIIIIISITITIIIIITIASLFVASSNSSIVSTQEPEP